LTAATRLGFLKLDLGQPRVRIGTLFARRRHRRVLCVSAAEK
jgi:hypothetical protein